MSEATLPTELWTTVCEWVDDRRSFRATCRKFRAIANRLISYATFGKRSGQYLTEAVAHNLFALPHLATVHLEVESGFGKLAKREWRPLSMSSSDLNDLIIRDADLGSPSVEKYRWMFDSFMSKPETVSAAVRDDSELHMFWLDGTLNQNPRLRRKELSPKERQHLPAASQKAHYLTKNSPYIGPSIPQLLSQSSLTTLLIDDPSFLDSDDVFAALGKISTLRTLRLHDSLEWYAPNQSWLRSDRLTEERLKHLEALPALANLTVVSTLSILSLLPLDAIPTLRCLELRSLLDDRRIADFDFVKKNTQLAELRLFQCSLDDQEGQALLTFSQLRVLEIQGHNFSDPVLNQLTALTIDSINISQKNP